MIASMVPGAGGGAVGMFSALGRTTGLGVGVGGAGVGVASLRISSGSRTPVARAMGSANGDAVAWYEPAVATGLWWPASTTAGLMTRMARPIATPRVRV